MVLINLGGLAIIVLIVWWFWLYKAKEVSLDDTTQVIQVENGTYQPAHIRVQAGHPIELAVLRKDASPCAEMLLVPDLDISESLPLNKTIKISLPSMEKGEYDFHCQMQMYRGVIKVT